MVYFVGAGPGDPSLITEKGGRLLGEADVVIYAGSLVNPMLLGKCREGTSVYDSAKMTLPQVIDVIKEAEAEGKMTVRLHTGDPAIYGAIREQMDELSQLGIEFDVVPGVSSMAGAAAALEAEYTLPGVSQSVIITRMQGRTPVPERENFKALASIGCSMVIFLSAGLLKDVRQGLLEGAYDEDTPAAIVYKATWPEEKVIRTTVGSLSDAGVKNGISKTALILVGDFLGEKYEKSLLYDPGFSTGYREGSRL